MPLAQPITHDGATDSEPTTTSTTSPTFAFADLKPLSDADHSGVQLTQYVFEARQEVIDMSGLMDQVTRARRQTADADLVLAVPLSSADMHDAFKNFGQVQGMDSATPLLTVAQASRTLLLQKASEWFDQLNNGVSYPTSAALGTDNIIENWQEVLFEIGMLLTKYFGETKLVAANKVVSRDNVKTLLGSAKIAHMFPLTDQQMLNDAQSWRNAYWGQSSTPNATGATDFARSAFTNNETDKMVMAFPYSYEIRNTNENTGDRTGFTSKLVFGVKNGDEINGSGTPAAGVATEVTVTATGVSGGTTVDGESVIYGDASVQNTA